MSSIAASAKPPAGCFFMPIHQTVRVTPAIPAGLTDHVREIEELVALLG
jgi:hypothetical protein